MEGKSTARNTEKTRCNFIILHRVCTKQHATRMCPLRGARDNIFHEGPFSSRIYMFLNNFMCRLQYRSQLLAYGALVVLVAWEWLERTVGVLGLSLDAAFL